MGITNFDVVQANSFLGAQMVTQGNVWYVKPSSGSNGNDGKTPATAFKTLAYALSAATANQNDIIYLIAESNTAGSTTDYQSSTLTWNKDLVHLIGVCSPSMVSQRARIAQLSTATGVSPLVNITANGCIFKNISIFHGVNDATSLVAAQVTGSRNYFKNVHFAGIGHATQVAANAASLKLDGAQENVFEDCVMGVDTITADNSTKGELWFDTSAARNMFRRCLFTRFISNAGYVHVSFQDTTAIDRWTVFEDCYFVSESANDATAQTAVFSTMAGMTQGQVILSGKTTIATPTGTSAVWAAAGANRIKNAIPVASTASVGGKFTTIA